MAARKAKARKGPAKGTRRPAKAAKPRKVAKVCTPAGAAQAKARAKAQASARRAQAARELAKAEALFRRFHEADPGSLERVTAPKAGAVAVLLGALQGVIYETPDGTRYLHEFRRAAAPTLAATADGSQLLVLGGRYRFTDRGIVDKPPRK